MISFRRWRADKSGTIISPMASKARCTSRITAKLFPTPSIVRVFYFLVVVVFPWKVSGSSVRCWCVCRNEYIPWHTPSPSDWFRLDASSSKVYLLCRGWKNVIDEVRVRGATKRDQEFSLLSYPASGRLPPGGLKPSPPPGLNTICDLRRFFLRRSQKRQVANLATPYFPSMA